MKDHNIKIEDVLAELDISISSDKIFRLINGKTIFVTGGAGSIGSEIVRQLASYKPYKLVVLDHAETPLSHLTLQVKNQFPDLDFYPIICDIRDEVKLTHLFSSFKPDLIYHCAAYKHVPMMEKNPSEAILVNIKGTKILADLAIKHHIQKFIFISTDKAVNPSSIMGATKRVAEMYLMSLGKKKVLTKFIITRFGNVLGSNGSVFTIFKNQIQQGQPVTITHPDMERYLMTIHNACKLIMEVSLIGIETNIYIFNMGDPIKIIDLAKKMICLSEGFLNKDVKIEFVGLRPGEKLYEEMLDDKSIKSPSHHEKIILIKEKEQDYNGVKLEVDKIIDIAKEYNSSKTVKKLKRLVSEFDSEKANK